MTRAYSRCNGGHYFSGTHCPLDGWSSAASVELAAAAERLIRNGRVPSIEELRMAGVAEEALSRTIVIEFGTRASAFDLIAPEGYIVDGTWIEKRAFDSRFL
jgi:hypothetical protein